MLKRVLSSFWVLEYLCLNFTDYQVKLELKINKIAVV